MCVVVSSVELHSSACHYTEYEYSYGCAVEWNCIFCAVHTQTRPGLCMYSTKSEVWLNFHILNCNQTFNLVVYM